MLGRYDLNMLNNICIHTYYMHCIIFFNWKYFFKDEVEDRLESPGCRESRHCWDLDPSVYLGPQHAKRLGKCCDFLESHLSSTLPRQF